jgi:hypothetical protein
MTVTAAAAQVPTPTLEGPVTGGTGEPFIAATTFDLATVGYTQAEYFISGTANAYTNVGLVNSDGMWTLTAGDSAAYKTRILVYRPIRPGKFRGTVLVEWLNVSGGLDAAPDWIMSHTELIRRGYAWVGVSAQLAGVEGGGGVVGLPSMALKEVDPVRYASLVHPGDSFSYDIFSQVGQSVRQPAAANPLGDLRITHVIAAGESQSAFRLVSYVNGIQPLHGLYDGFLIHSRGDGAAPISEAPQSAINAPTPALIRTDLAIPVLTFQTETDMNFLGYFNARQPDTDRFRLWEVAGTAHADTYTTTVGPTDLGDSPDVANVLITTEPVPGLISCAQPINSGPQHWVLKAAIHALNRWVRTGRPPAIAPRLDVTAPPITIQRDEHGNALGGIRSPWVDAPVASHSGSGQTGSLLCLLFGTTYALDGPTLDALYPSHRDYVRAVRGSLREAARQRWIRRRDARLIKKAAEASDIGK